MGKTALIVEKTICCLAICEQCYRACDEYKKATTPKNTSIVLRFLFGSSGSVDLYTTRLPRDSVGPQHVGIFRMLSHSGNRPPRLVYPSAGGCKIGGSLISIFLKGLAS